jgi:RHS repeat-associated protein
MRLFKFFQLLLICALATSGLLAQARVAENVHQEKFSFENTDCICVCALQAQTEPREFALFPVASVSGETYYNYYRSYQATQGRYTQNDPIGLDGGLNRSIYVDANPLSFTDPDGLKGRPSRGRSTASDAAGYHDPRGNLVCEQWTCPSNSSMCMPGDQKRPTDFLPVATTEAPRGCSCTRYAYRPDWRPPNQDISDDWNRTRDLLGDAYNTHRDAKDQAPRFNNGLGRLPHWHRLGGYGK